MSKDELGTDRKTEETERVSKNGFLTVKIRERCSMRKKSASPDIEKRSELFYSGRDCRAYDYMGAHPFVQDGEQGYLFRVYAPERRTCRSWASSTPGTATRTT